MLALLRPEINMKNIRLVLFDLDGTLVDTSDIVYKSFNHIFRKYGHKEINHTTFFKVFGKRPEQVFNELGYAFVDAKKAAQDFFDYQLANFQEIKVFPFATETLLYLKLKGFKIGIYTNANRNKAEKIVNENLKMKISDLDILVTGEDVINPKPHPEGILRAMQQLNIRSNETTYVGDSEADIAAARSAGVIAILVTQNEDKSYVVTKPDIKISFLRELQSIL